MFRRVATTALAATVALTLAACTINIGTSGTSTTRSSTSTPTSTTLDVPPGTLTPQPRVSGTSVDAGAYLQPESDEFVAFSSPSRNINCNIGAGSAEFADFVRCDTYEYTYTPPPKPADCEFEWGVAIGTEGFLCVSDATNPGCELPYGSNLTFGSITCVSREDGVTCVDESQGGRGFRVARASYELF